MGVFTVRPGRKVIEVLDQLRRPLAGGATERSIVCLRWIGLGRKARLGRLNALVRLGAMSPLGMILQEIPPSRGRILLLSAQEMESLQPGFRRGHLRRIGMGVQEIAVGQRGMETRRLLKIGLRALSLGFIRYFVLWVCTAPKQSQAQQCMEQKTTHGGGLYHVSLY